CARELRTTRSDLGLAMSGAAGTTIDTPSLREGLFVIQIVRKWSPNTDCAISLDASPPVTLLGLQVDGNEPYDAMRDPASVRIMTAEGPVPVVRVERHP